MMKRRVSIHLVVIFGLWLNLVIYSVVTTVILYLMGSHGGVVYLLFIPIRVYHVSGISAFLAQFVGIVVGLLFTAVPIRLYHRRRVSEQ